MSNTTKHTPGPWTIDKDGRSILYQNPLMGPSRFLAHDTFTEPFKAEQRANMALIAAAPDLLEALNLILGSFALERVERFDLVEKAKTAIKKATSE